MKENIRIIFRRFILLIILVATIAISLWGWLRQVSIVDQRLDINHNAVTGYTDCTVTIVLDSNADSVDATVYYYDSQKEYISSDIVYFKKVDDKTWQGESCVLGKVQYCSIEYCTVFSTLRIVIVSLSIPCLCVALGLFISSCRHRCNIYKFESMNILIYTGWFNHYMKIDGEIVDEYNSSSIRVPIELWCEFDDGTDVYAVISTSHRIKLKINGRLYRR